ncbi:hypothetical protein BDF22DRAFT_438898 [Syncephalis plumigaleata]|nr:hypothetical protein BDF22DRAFT_438898 [Syncephalis plumigaleata]
MPSRSRSRSRSPSKRRRHRSPRSSHREHRRDDRTSSTSGTSRHHRESTRESTRESHTSSRRHNRDKTEEARLPREQTNNTSSNNETVEKTQNAEPVKIRNEEEEEKIRLRRERVERWRTQREAARKVNGSLSNVSTPTSLGNVSDSPAGTDTDNTSSGIKATSLNASKNSIGFRGFKPTNMLGKPQRNGLRMSLEGEDEQPAASGTVATNPGTIAATTTQDTQNDATMEVDEVDPLDAFMVGVSAEVSELAAQDSRRMQAMANETPANAHKMITDTDNNAEVVNNSDDDEVGSDPEDILALAAKKAAKRKDIAQVDHSKMDYEPFRKDFYVEPVELAEMTQYEVDLLRAELDGIKIRGVRPPKPVKRWTHCGFPAACYDVIHKLGYEKPTPIQAQGIPAILGGRDVIGIAKTGSGKTMAFLLPMFRHIKDQRPLGMMEGPIALIMTPTRELAVQIHRDCKPFLKALNLRAVCAYGGAPIKDQIADLKRGAEIIVCTPGRMIDLLCANAGRLTNLARITYLVLDEADRMFDMGFEPQVMKIVNNIRPNRQTVLFSATFPRQMEALARKVLRKPLEITVGERSVVCDDVEQVVEVRSEDSKFIRLLEILGNFYNDSKDQRTLIFVDRQEAADNLMRDLMRRGYSALSLHGGKDQMDRDSTISDFKAGVVPILVATSVAARGLDVKMLSLVVNYDCPNHMEDYVHRVGRTGRAGNKGTAYTFITPEQDRFAVDIVKALKLSKIAVPESLQKMADDFVEQVKAGKAFKAGSGFSGKGLERLDQERDLVKKIQKKRFGGADGNESEEETTTDDVEAKIKKMGGGEPTATTTTATTTAEGPSTSDDTSDALKRAQQRAAMVNSALGAKSGLDIVEQINRQFARTTSNITANAGATTAAGAAATAAAAAAAVAARVKAPNTQAAYSFEIEINDYPRKARWRVTSKEEITRLTEDTGAAITTRGSFYEPGKTPAEGDRKLHLLVEAESEMAWNESRRKLNVY